MAITIVGLLWFGFNHDNDHDDLDHDNFNYHYCRNSCKEISCIQQNRNLKGGRKLNKKVSQILGNHIYVTNKNIKTNQIFVNKVKFSSNFTLKNLMMPDLILFP